MALDNFKNNVKVTVSLGYDNVATSIVLQAGDGAKLPTAPFNAEWWNSTDYTDPTDDPNKEIVRVTTRSTDTLTIVRAQESTSASTKNTAGKIYQMVAGLTAKTLTTDIPATYTAYNATMTTSGGIPYVTGAGTITEDANNLFWNDATAVLGIGTNTPAGIIHGVNITTGGQGAFIADSYGANSAIFLRRANGTGTSPTALSSGDLVARFAMQGHNGSAFTARKAGIEMNAAENWGTAANGAYISIQTTPIGSTVIAEAVRITDAGRVGIDNSTPISELEVVSTDTTNSYRGITSSQYSTGAQAARFNLFHARGSKASPTTLANNDNLGNIGFLGFGTATGIRAAIFAQAGTVSGDTVPGNLIFQTTPDTEANVAERMRITSGGAVGIGTSAPATVLHVVDNGGAGGITLDGTSNPGITLKQNAGISGRIGIPSAAGGWCTDAAAGDIVFRIASGNLIETVDNGVSARRITRPAKTLTSTATQTTTMFTVLASNNSIVAGNIYYSVESIDTVNHKMANETGIFGYVFGQNNGTGITTSITSNKLAGFDVAGDQTVTWSIVNSVAGTAVITCAIVTFASPTSVKITTTIENFGRQAITPS